jgi:DUF4097 and DUF4098 domain-containing protein YvlB
MRSKTFDFSFFFKPSVGDLTSNVHDWLRTIIKLEAEDEDIDVDAEGGKHHSPQTMLTITLHEAPLAAHIDHLHHQEEANIRVATVHAHLTEAEVTIHTTTGG